MKMVWKVEDSQIQTRITDEKMSVDSFAVGLFLMSEFQNLDSFGIFE